MIIALTIIAVALFIFGWMMMLKDEIPDTSTIPVFLSAIFFLLLAFLWKINPFW